MSILGYTASGDFTGKFPAIQIASGVIVGNYLSSGAVQSGHIGNASVNSGNISSGSIGTYHIGSGQLTGFELGSGAIVSGRISSGQIGGFHIGSGQVRGSVQASPFDNTHIASGSLNGFELASGSVVSGRIASGQIGQYHLASGTPSQSLSIWVATAELISGNKAVVWGSGGSVVRAERQSGLRMPAFGVVVSGGVSGEIVEVVILGPIGITISGAVASGFVGQRLFVGSGGHLVNLSGFMGGDSSGPGVGSFSGSFVQSVGFATNSGVFVNCGEMRLATLSGSYLMSLSGSFPISGYV